MSKSPDVDATENTDIARRRELVIFEDSDGKSKDIFAKKGYFCYKQVCLSDNSDKSCAVCEVAAKENADVDHSTKKCKCKF